MSEDRVTTRGDIVRQKKREQPQTVICISRRKVNT